MGKQFFVYGFVNYSDTDNECEAIDVGYISGVNVAHALSCRWNVINCLISKNKYSSYLEVGACFGDCLQHVIAAQRVGIEPSPAMIAKCKEKMRPDDVLYEMDSDTYFATYPDHRFDIIFIDANHLYKNSMDDIINSLRILNPQGTIVTHDSNLNGGQGVWKALLCVRLLKLGKIALITDADCGLGIIQHGENPPVDEVDAGITAEYIQTLDDRFPISCGLAARQQLERIINAMTREEFCTQVFQ